MTASRRRRRRRSATLGRRSRRSVTLRRRWRRGTTLLRRGLARSTRRFAPPPMETKRYAPPPIEARRYAPPPMEMKRYARATALGAAAEDGRRPAGADTSRPSISRRRRASAPRGPAPKCPDPNRVSVNRGAAGAALAKSGTSRGVHTVIGLGTKEDRYDCANFAPRRRLGLRSRDRRGGAGFGPHDLPARRLLLQHRRPADLSAVQLRLRL